MIFQFSDGEFSDPIAISLKMWKKSIVLSLFTFSVTLEKLNRNPQAWWKSRRKDLKIPWANKEVTLPNLLLKTSWDKNLFLCWGSMLIYSRRSLYITLLSLLAEPQKTLCSLPHLTFQAFQNCKQKGTFWEIRDCCCFIEVSLVCVLYYNRECSWKPVLPSIDVHYILIWIQVAWIKVLLLAFCHFDKGTSEDQLSFKRISCEISHFGICCGQIQRCSFYLLKSWGAHWTSGKAKDLMSTHTRKFNIWGLGLN